VGVIVGVGVNVGIAFAVCVAAALAVWAMNVLTAPGFGVEADGTASEGTHARITARLIIQMNNCVLWVAAIFPLPHPKRNQVRKLFFIFQL
jgi:hypothetical protein